MELIFLTWIMIAHCIYMYHAVKITNTNSDVSLTDMYVNCLAWPFAIVDIAKLCLAYVIDGIGWAWEYLGDIYWDIDCFVAYMQTIARKP